jgi:diguanylate cyclase (GGDEF)-like protein/PAS domain S-box-containing protein
MMDHQDIESNNSQSPKPLSKREWRLLHLIDNAKLGMVVIDQSHQVLEANQRFLDMLGYTLEEARSLHTWDWEAASSKDEIKRDFIDLSQADFNIETQHRRKDGSLFDVEISGTGFNFGDLPENNAILCFCNDISDRKKAQQALIQSERRFKSYVENAADILFDINSQGVIQYISPNCEQILGYKPQELTGGYLHERVFDDQNAFSEDIRLFIANQPRPVCEYRLKHKNGSYEWYNFKFTKIYEEATGETVIVCVARNINYQKEHEAQLEYLSMHDQLTGIYNRGYFFEELKRIDQLNLYPISVLIFDLDDLKVINDKYGHAAGDDTLARTTAAVTKVLRKNDVFARIGGDEFTILLPAASNAEAELIAQRIREVIECHNVHSQHPDISISIGIATKTGPVENMNTVLQLADQLMYKEKKSKKMVRDQNSF